jgi:hypothetical protein
MNDKCSCGREKDKDDKECLFCEELRQDLKDELKNESRNEIKSIYDEE